MITREQSLDMEALEAMVNRHGLSGVLAMLAQIAAERTQTKNSGEPKNDQIR